MKNTMRNHEHDPLYLTAEERRAGDQADAFINAAVVVIGAGVAGLVVYALLGVLNGGAL